MSKDIQVVINISEEIIKAAKENPNYYPTYQFETIWKSICNGTVLPKRRSNKGIAGKSQYEAEQIEYHDDFETAARKIHDYEERQKQNNKKCDSYNNTNKFKSCSNCKLIGTDSCYMVCGGSKSLYKPKQKSEPCDECLHNHTSICGNCKDYDEFDKALCNNCLFGEGTEYCRERCPYESKTEQEPMREFTEEEVKAHSKALDKMYKPTGFNVFNKPCKDAISREDARMMLTCEIKDDMTITKYIKMVDKRLRKLPPVTSSSQKGHWIPIYQGDEIINYHCSECELGDTNGSTNLYGWDYCRRCGAEMESANAET